MASLTEVPPISIVSREVGCNGQRTDGRTTRNIKPPFYDTAVTGSAAYLACHAQTKLRHVLDVDLSLLSLPLTASVSSSRTLNDIYIQVNLRRARASGGDFPQRGIHRKTVSVGQGCESHAYFPRVTEISHGQRAAHYDSMVQSLVCSASCFPISLTHETATSLSKLHRPIHD